MRKYYPIPRGTTLRIWNSLRQRYSINPASFKSRDALVGWIKKRNRGLANTIRNTTFWDHTKDLYPHRTGGHVRAGMRVQPYARSRPRGWKDVEVEVLRTLKVRDGLRGRTLVAEFSSYYPGRTYPSIITKASRIKAQ